MATQYVLDSKGERAARTHRLGDDRAKVNGAFAMVLEERVIEILEQNASTRPWGNVDKTKLPASCFLWVEDPEKKSTWHLPYREGAGGIDPDTGMYRSAGPINVSALRAISQAVGGARTGSPMNVPTEIKAKIKRLLKQHKIGDYKESASQRNGDAELFEESIAGQFQDVRLDTENGIIAGVSVLRPTSSNSTYRNGKGRRYSEQALNSVARLISGAKAYADHMTKSEQNERRGVRSVKDLIGYYENGRIEGGIVRADLHYLRSQKDWLEPLAEQMGDKIGLSIHAYGPSHLDDTGGEEIVDDVRILASADLVTETGSTRNLFESGAPDDEDETFEEEVDAMTLSEVTLDQLRAENPGLVKQLREQFEAEQEDSDKLASIQKEIATLKEENGSLKKELDDYKVKEQESVREARILELIDESKLDKRFVTDVFMESLRSAKNEDAMKAIIDDRKKIAASGKRTGVKNMGDSTEVHESDEKPVEDAEYVEATGAKAKEAS